MQEHLVFRNDIVNIFLIFQLANGKNHDTPCYMPKTGSKSFKKKKNVTACMSCYLHSI
jgi:hypothetical protein